MSITKIDQLVDPLYQGVNHLNRRTFENLQLDCKFINTKKAITDFMYLLAVSMSTTNRKFGDKLWDFQKTIL